MADERDELDDLIDTILASRRGFKEDIIRSRPMDLVDMLSSGLQGLGLEPRQAARSAGRFRDVFSMAPLTGDMEDARDILHGGLEGDVRKAGLGALGFIPFIGGAVKKGGGNVINFLEELMKRKGKKPNVIDDAFDRILDRPENLRFKKELDKLDIPTEPNVRELMETLEKNPAFKGDEVTDFSAELMKRRSQRAITKAGGLSGAEANFEILKSKIRAAKFSGSTPERLDEMKETLANFERLLIVTRAEANPKPSVIRHLNEFDFPKK